MGLYILYMGHKPLTKKGRHVQVPTVSTSTTRHIHRSLNSTRPLDHGAEGKLAVRCNATQQTHGWEDVLTKSHNARAAFP